MESSDFLRCKVSVDWLGSREATKMILGRTVHGVKIARDVYRSDSGCDNAAQRLEDGGRGEDQGTRGLIAARGVKGNSIDGNREEEGQTHYQGNAEYLFLLA